MPGLHLGRICLNLVSKYTDTFACLWFRCSPEENAHFLHFLVCTCSD
ncbi:hypothetical protein MICAC_690007 [Microcystis aeruginosa PCC 9443]|uniref:Uncharacterized protein n=1 Tax=Microcystis aeruginosa PCC 9443 TaxID=1160281 RepID=I4GB17_MICAE|nr:hypothetical protein MICAC_690007 [Microcystis aeruginosa PCC 9443]